MLSPVKLPIVMTAVLAALLAVPASAPAARSVPQGFFGVMYDHGIEQAPDDVQDPQWDLMASSGVETVRTVFDWGEAQRDGRGSAIDFARTDGIVRRAALRNLDVLPVVLYAPRWARAYRTASPRRRSDAATT